MSVNACSGICTISPAEVANIAICGILSIQVVVFVPNIKSVNDNNNNENEWWPEKQKTVVFVHQIYVFRDKTYV